MNQNNEITNNQGIFVPIDSDRHQQPCNVLGNLRIDAKVSSEDTNGGLFLLENVSNGKGGPPRHIHHEQEEWFYAVAGEFIVEIGGQRHHLKPGDSVLAPRQVPHVWAHVSEGTGRLLVTFQPAGAMEAFFEEFAKMTDPAPKEEMQQLFRAHGMEIVGPPL
ncbi:MAG: cupin domain-containing protein [Caldilineaceae bacterium]